MCLGYMIVLLNNSTESVCKSLNTLNILVTLMEVKEKVKKIIALLYNMCTFYFELYISLCISMFICIMNYNLHAICNKSS